MERKSPSRILHIVLERKSPSRKLNTVLESGEKVTKSKTGHCSGVWRESDQIENDPRVHTVSAAKQRRKPMDRTGDKSSTVGSNNLSKEAGPCPDQNMHLPKSGKAESEESFAPVAQTPEKEEEDTVHQKDESAYDGVPYDTGWAWVVLVGKAPLPHYHVVGLFS